MRPHATELRVVHGRIPAVVTRTNPIAKLTLALGIFRIAPLTFLMNQVAMLNRVVHGMGLLATANTIPHALAEFATEVSAVGITQQAIVAELMVLFAKAPLAAQT